MFHSRILRFNSEVKNKKIHRFKSLKFLKIMIFDFLHFFSVVGTANNLDLYPLMCYVLGVVPAPNNGTLRNMLEVLKVPIAPTHSLLTRKIEVV